MVFVLVLVAPAQDPPLGIAVTGRVFVVGRGPDAHLVLPEPTVSLRHLCLKKRGENYLVTDEGSTNGTSISSGASEPVFLPVGAPRVLQDGDRLRLGHVELVVTSDVDGVELIVDRSDLPRRLVASALAERGLPADDESVDGALRELLGSPDESLLATRPERAPPLVASAPLEDPKNDPRVTDALLFGFALAVLGLGLGGLYWLLGG